MINLRNIWYKLDGKIPVPIKDIHEMEQVWKDNRVVGKTTILNSTVSTIFLGLDHSYSENTPVLFETMIFGGPFDEEMWRYHTWEQAEVGHLYACDMIHNDFANKISKILILISLCAFLITMAVSVLVFNF